MLLLLLGVALGAATIIPPGPVTLSLVHVGAQKGRTSGLEAGVGVALGDALIAVIALAIVSLGAATSPRMATLIAVVGTVIMGLSGGLLLFKPTALDGIVSSMRRPGRSLFALTTLTPSTLMGWIAIIGALPAGDLQDRLIIAAGVVLFSIVWHPAIGLMAGHAGESISPETLRRVTRAGGLALMVTGAAMWVL